MKLVLLLVLPVLIYSTTYSQSYKLVWSDEFNGTSLDLSKWSNETGNNNGYGNSELEYYTARSQNCSIANGTLTINALKENYSGFNYTSARINTKNKFSFKYGKIEARIKLPYGKGIWPAFWLLGDSFVSLGWPACGETDIMEMVGGDGKTPSGTVLSDSTIYGTAHWSNNGAHAQYGNSYTLKSGKFSDDFHTFSVTWDRKQIVWYVDGIQYNSIDITSPGLSAFQNKFFILINLAVGGNWPGYPDNSTVFPQTLEVDYVRVYQDTTSFPYVNIISPQNNSSFVANSNISLDANATIQEGNITKVEFYQGAMKIGETYVSPYQMTWNSVLSGNYRITCTAYSNTGLNSISDTINVKVGSNAATSPYGGTAAQIPGTIEAENFDIGGQGNAYYDSDAQNSGGLYRTFEGVDIEACSDIGGGYDIGWTQNNEWLVYTISVKDSGTYQIGARVASSSGGGLLHFEVDDTDITGTINVPSTGGWQTWTTILSKNFSLAEGVHQLKLFINSTGFNINKIEIYPPETNPSINFIYPAGGEQFSPDSIVQIKWDSRKISKVNIGFSTKGGSNWSSIQNGVDAKFGVYRWKTPEVNSSNCKLIIAASDNMSVIDTSKSAFSIGTVNSVYKDVKAPSYFSLSQNYPNPFNPSTTINYHVPNEGLVIIKIYNLLGKEIKTLVNEKKYPGEYKTVWNGKDLYGNDAPSGIYFYSIYSGNLKEVKKMVLLR